MGRRKHHIYPSRVSPHSHLNTTRRLSTSKATSEFSSLQQRLPISKRIPRATLHQSIRKCTFKVLSKAETLRTGLVLVAGISALLNAGLCVVGYYGVIGKGGEMRVKVGLLGMEVVISIAEIVCIVVYWNMVVKIGDTRNAALSVQYVADASLLQARGTLAICMFECICHLFIPIPVLQVNTLVRLFGIDMAADLNDYLYAMVLLRNYHVLRAFYWFSQFSSMRTLMYARITNVSSQGGFTFRCCLAAYKFTLILLIYGAMVMVGGFIQTILERESILHSDKTAWSGLWVVAYTQSTIGYGDEAPVTFQAQVSMIVSVFLGSVLMGLLTNIISNAISLDLKEFQYCSYLLSSRYKQKDTLVVVLVIQSWWRLICSRIRRQPHGPSIVHFYSSLRRFRAVLVRCNTIKSGLLQNQVAAIGENVGNSLRGLNVYLYAVNYVEEMV